MLGMCASAIAACACTHHPVKAKKETASCHVAPPETQEVENVVDLLSSDSAGEVCQCFVRTVSPAIFAKNESKKLSPQPADSIAGNKLIEQVVTSRFWNEDASANFAASIFHSQPSFRLWPARAPPRL